MRGRNIFLSYHLCSDTPGYGAREKFEMYHIGDMAKGDISNHSKITTSLHLGTHIDFPKHFFAEGLSSLDFDANFFVFEKPLFIELEPKSKIVEKELIDKLDVLKDESYDILLIKTREGVKRNQPEYFEQNTGFSAKIATFLREYYPKVRVVGFDTISVSSITDRASGREAHKSFLNPYNPILLLEDMDLSQLDTSVSIKKIIVAPLRVFGADAALCTVICELND